MFENIKSAFRSLSSGLHCAPPLSGAYCTCTVRTYGTYEYTVLSTQYRYRRYGVNKLFSRLLKIDRIDLETDFLVGFYTKFSPG